MVRPRVYGNRGGFASGAIWPIGKAQSAIDAFLTTFTNTLSTAQSGYFATHNRYWQGLVSHSTIILQTPFTEADAVPTQMTSAPTDQPERWQDILPSYALVKFPCRIKIDTYHGPSGKGYTVNAELVLSGIIYRRILNFGPEANRETGWHTPNPVIL